MSLFMLDTEVVSSCGASLKSLSSELSSICDSVNSYDINCEDGFDFSSAKSVISKNVEACSIKILNSYNFLEQVVSSHTQLQNSLKFAFPGEEKEESLTTSSEDSSDNYSSNYGYSGGGASISGGRGGSHSSGGSNHNSSPSDKVSYVFNDDSQESIIQPSPVVPVIDPTKSDNDSTSQDSIDKNSSTTDITSTDSEKNSSDNDSDIEVQNNNSDNTSTNIEQKSTDDNNQDNLSGSENISKDLSVDDVKIYHAGYAYADVDNLTSDAKKIFSGDDFKYVDGYGHIGSRYIISCDKSYGKVGDIIQFEQSDGSSIECIIGVVTTGNDYKNSVNFIVDKNNLSSVKPLDVVSKLVSENRSIVNHGNYQSNNNNSAFGFIFNPLMSDNSSGTVSSSNSTSVNQQSITGEEAL